MSGSIFQFAVPWLAGVAVALAGVWWMRWLNRPRPRRDDEEWVTHLPARPDRPAAYQAGRESAAADDSEEG